MRSIAHVSAIGLLLVLLTAALPGMTTPAMADGFSNADIDGDYGYSLRGTAVDVFGNRSELTGIGQFSAVNGVTTRHTRTFNVGGFGLVDGTLFGQAEVQPDGRGVVVFCGANTVRPPAILPFFPRKSLEVFEFVLTSSDSSVIVVIGNRFDPLPDDFDIMDCPSPSQLLPGPVSSTGLLITVRRQDVPGDDDD